MAKGVSAAEKRTRILDWFHETKTYFQLKEVEKRVAKEKGITRKHSTPFARSTESPKKACLWQEKKKKGKKNVATLHPLEMQSCLLSCCAGGMDERRYAPLDAACTCG